MKSVSMVVDRGLCPRSFGWLADEANSLMLCKQTFQIDPCPVLELLPLPQAKPDTFRAYSVYLCTPTTPDYRSPL